MIGLNLPGKVKPTAYKVTSTLLAHKILILVLILLSLVIGVLVQLRANFIAQIKIAHERSSLPTLSYSPAPKSTEIASDSAVVPEESSVLGVSTEKTTFTPIYYPSLAPIPSYVPIPTLAPTSTAASISTPSTTTVSSPSVSAPASSSSSAKNCSNLGTSPGVATAWYSQASHPQTVGDTGIITIELKDCNNNVAPVGDTLTISQTSGPSTTVNGNSPPITVTAKNGQASFTVKSKTSGTATYTVRNTTKSFNVTDPNNKHPQVTFTIAAPVPTPASNAASPTPSPSPSPSPSASTPAVSSTPTPVPSSTSSPSPTSSAVSSPSSSPN